MVLHLENFSYSFQGEPLFKGSNLNVFPGEIVGLAGPSGVGKSTLLNLIGGLLNNIEGKIQVTSHLSYMWQRDRLLPWRTVIENVILPCELKKDFNIDLSKLKAMSLLKEMGLLESTHLYPHQISCGMRQRAALAQALVTDPKLLLLDEPFAAIDYFRKKDLYQLLLILREKMNLAILLVSHQLEDFERLADRIYLIQEREVEEVEFNTLLSAL